MEWFLGCLVCAIEFRFHVANWIPLVEANGVFEAEPILIWSRVYAYMKPDVTVETVKKILAAFVRIGLVQVWEANGNTWAYFIGMDKRGRLPTG